MTDENIEIYGGSKFADIFERAKKVASSCGGSYTFEFNGVSVTVTADSDYQTTWQEYLRAYDEGGVGMDIDAMLTHIDNAYNAVLFGVRQTGSDNLGMALRRLAAADVYVRLEMETNDSLSGQFVGKDAGEFVVGDSVKKITGEYRFNGVVVGVVEKLSGQRRYVVENADGVLHIFGPQNLARVEGDDD